MNSETEKTVLEITNDPTSARFILETLIDALMPEGTAMSWPVAQAVSRLKEAKFWLGEEMFGKGGHFSIRDEAMAKDIDARYSKGTSGIDPDLGW